MAEQVLKDAMGRILGYIDSDSSGQYTIKDSMKRIKGYYDPKLNQTRDSMNRIVGTGNLLTTLL